MSELKELWNAIGAQKEKEFHKKYPDFVFTKDMFEETLGVAMKYRDPVSLEKSTIDKKIKEEKRMSRPKLTLKTFQKEEVNIPNPKPKRVGRPRKNIEEKPKKPRSTKVTARTSDKRTSLGTTPLMYAAAAGNMIKVKQLIASGTDIRLKDRNGICARGYALENDHMEIVKLLSDVLASDREKSRKINQSSSITFIEGNRREFEEVTKSLKEDNFGLTVLMIAGIISAALSIVGLIYYFVSEIVS